MLYESAFSHFFKMFLKKHQAIIAERDQQYLKEQKSALNQKDQEFFKASEVLRKPYFYD